MVLIREDACRRNGKHRAEGGMNMIQRLLYAAVLVSLVIGGVFALAAESQLRIDRMADDRE